ncbi:RTA1 like protein [Amylocystis lapponica]|nr:RTA1 like protein [Amylocystis lapponica]
MGTPICQPKGIALGPQFSSVSDSNFFETLLSYKEGETELPNLHLSPLQTRTSSLVTTRGISMASNSTAVDDNSPYHYVPLRSACIIFVVLFSISTAAHIFEALFFLRRRGWWLFPTVCLCGLGEIIGWSARLWSSINVLNGNAYLIQIITTIIAPTPLLAGIFIIFSQVIARLGERYSRLSPRNYSRIFLTFDIVALVIQAAGGGMADSDDYSTSVNVCISERCVVACLIHGDAQGGHIMLAGIAFQLASITIFCTCVSEFFYRYLKDKPLRRVQSSTSVETLTFGSTKPPMTSSMQLMISGMLFTTLCLFIRAIYRTIELSDGFGSPIQTRQVLFNVLDGGMVTLAMYALNVFHPGFLLHPEDTDEAFHLQK